MPRNWTRAAALAMAGAIMIAVSAGAGDPTASLKQGNPQIKSAGPLGFGPDGILFVGDTQGSALFAIDTGDRTAAGQKHAVKVNDLGAKVAGMLGTDPKQVMINDLAVNPISGNVYLSVARGRGPDATPVLMRLGADGKLDEVALDNVRYARAEIPNAPDASQEGSERAVAAERVHHRRRLRRRPRLPRRVVERGVLLPADRDPVPLQRGIRWRGDRDLSRRPRPVRDQVAGPHLRSLQDRQRPLPAGGLHLHPAGEGPGRRAEGRARTSRGRPSPSWATATAPST